MVSLVERWKLASVAPPTEAKQASRGEPAGALRGSVCQLRHEEVFELSHIHELYGRATAVTARWAQRTAATFRLLGAKWPSDTEKHGEKSPSAPLLSAACFTTADGYLWGAEGGMDLPRPTHEGEDLFLNLWLSGPEESEHCRWQREPIAHPKSVTVARYDAGAGTTEWLPLPLLLSSDERSRSWHQRLQKRCQQLHDALGDDQVVERLGATPAGQLGELSRVLRRVIRQTAELTLETALPDLHALGDESLQWTERARRRVQGTLGPNRWRPQPACEPELAPLQLGHALDTLSALHAWEQALATSVDELWHLATGAGERRLEGQLVEEQGGESIWRYQPPVDLQGPVSLRAEVETQGVPRDLSWRMARSAQVGTDQYPATTEYQPCNGGGYELCLARSMSWPEGNCLFLTMTSGLEPRVFCRTNSPREESSP